MLINQRKCLVLLIIGLVMLGCSSKNKNAEPNNVYADWDLIYLDKGKTRYILEAGSDSLTISTFSWENVPTQRGEEINRRKLGSVQHRLLAKDIKQEIVEKAISTFKNPQPVESFTTDYVGNLSLCIKKKGTTLCCYLSNGVDYTQPQTEVRKIIQLVEEIEKN